MTEKQTAAERLRELAESGTMSAETRKTIWSIADELDPQRHTPGTVVWWRDAEGLGEWSLGQINNNRKVEFFGAWKELDTETLQIKPARIAGPMQVVVCSEELVDAVKALEDLRPEDVRSWFQYYIAEAAARREAEG